MNAALALSAVLADALAWSKGWALGFAVTTPLAALALRLWLVTIDRDDARLDLEIAKQLVRKELSARPRRVEETDPW